MSRRRFRPVEEDRVDTESTFERESAETPRAPEMVSVTVSTHALHDVYRVWTGGKRDGESRFVHRSQWNHEGQTVSISRAEWDGLMRPANLTSLVWDALVDLPQILATIQAQQHVVAPEMIDSAFVNAVANHVAMEIKRKVKS